ncbi:oxidoreductase, zinc-binding dehydrogenase family [Mycobacterium kansasii 662]|uniref:Oxidoreductase, zinc-binding dehydrogenase family n=1 Tax=Mycobacterium kansasii 662 TaxID=1299326 RepID=X7YHY7_MYCKA|nr:oxidoreductase, zinc-binding dehydrogenase family [Mycobacterium kansasii 662]
MMGVEASGVVLETGPRRWGFSPSATESWGLFPEGTGTIAGHRPTGCWSRFRRAGRTPRRPPRRWCSPPPITPLPPFWRRCSRGNGSWVHAATGGVGMAAVQLARHWGLEVFATASKGKWDTFAGHGLLTTIHISDSRSLEFEEQVPLRYRWARRWTWSWTRLAGDFVDCVAASGHPGGAFLEMGKTDIREPEVIAQQYPGSALPSFRPLRGRTGPHCADSCRTGRAVRRRGAATVAGPRRSTCVRAPAALR